MGKPMSVGAYRRDSLLEYFALGFEILTIRHLSTRLGGASEPKAQHTQRLTKLLNVLPCKDGN